MAEMKRDTRRVSRYFVFATVSLSLLMTGVAGTSIAVALEAIRSSFDASVILVGWVIAIFQLGLTASMPVVGKISDVLGRRLTFMACVGLYTAGSAMAALSPNIGLLRSFPTPGNVRSASSAVFSLSVR
jgi:MFS family permease